MFIVLSLQSERPDPTALRHAVQGKPLDKIPHFVDFPRAFAVAADHNGGTNREDSDCANGLTDGRVCNFKWMAFLAARRQSCRPRAPYRHEE
jgi:hypothetical protein